MTVRSLSESEVHLWHIPLRASPERVGTFRETMSADEKQRADRFVFNQHRERFTIGRAALRQILAQYVGRAPVAIEFQYNARGKPLLSPGVDIAFNLTHSSDLALLAVTRGRQVGIDLEAIRPLEDADRMAASYFAPGEIIAYRSLSAEKKLEGFFLYWTLKEAYIKARGGGLSLPLDGFTMVPSDADGIYRVESPGDADANRWRAVRLAMPPQFIASLVVEGQDCQLVRLHWDAAQNVEG